MESSVEEKQIRTKYEARHVGDCSEDQRKAERQSDL